MRWWGVGAAASIMVLGPEGQTRGKVGGGEGEGEREEGLEREMGRGGEGNAIAWKGRWSRMGG